MNRFLRVSALCACAALCAALCGCVPSGGETSEPSPTATAAVETTVVTTAATTTTSPLPATPALCYDKSDSLSPYEATTRVNRALAPLMFEGLTAVSADYTATLCLAEKIEKTDATHLTVTLKKGLKFSENSAVKAADVAASFRLAARSETHAALVADVASVTAKNDRTLAVTLERAVPFYEAELSFPVVKTVKKRTVGTGLYRLDTKKTGLEKNPYNKTKVNIDRFELESVSRRQQQQFALETGSVCVYFDDLANGTAPRTVTGVTRTPVTMPYLVFLGFNANRAPWSSAALRGSLSYAVSRTEVAAAGFSGFAVPTATPFCPAWGALKDVTGASLSEERAKAVAVWKKNGYNVSENGKVKNRLSAELICRKDNAMHKATANELATQLKAAGMQVSVKPLSESEYAARLSSGNYDLYVGEVRLPNTLSLDAVLTGSGGAAYGISAGGYALWTQYKSGKLTTQEFVTAFYKETPFLPLCYAQGLTLTSPRLAGIRPSGVSAFDGVEQWIFT